MSFLAKSFLEKWTQKEIDEYVDAHGILVLFSVDKATMLAYPAVYGLDTNEDREKIIVLVMSLFASTNLNQTVCIKINELAKKWYNKNILKKKARVINFKKEKK